MDRLHAKELIAIRDLNSVYESLLIRAFVGFEQFCEELFFMILKKKIKYSDRKIGVNVECPTHSALYTVIIEKGKFLDWLPFDKTLQRVERYIPKKGGDLVCGRPFWDLDRASKDILQRIYLTRNAVAHASTQALEKFENGVIGSLPVLPRDRVPANFLRSQVTAVPKRVRLEEYLINLGAIAKTVFGTPLKET
jgi:hypothetical protein